MRRRTERTNRRTAEAIAASRVLCAGSLYDFVQEAWPVLEPARPFVGGWAIRAICRHLEAVTAGEIQYLLITVPPGMMKSLAVSVFWPAWEWGPAGRPGRRYLASSYAEPNVLRDATKMRRLVQSAWYQARWGETVALTRDQNAKLKFENTATGGREGRAFGSMTGGRGDVVIIDDPHSVDTAESDRERAATITTFREAIADRLNDMRTSAIVVIMQRLHEADVAGTILSLGLPYVHLNLPMEFEPDRACRTRIGFADPRSDPGELLFPERFPAAEVAGLKKAKGAYAYAGQYQQRPGPREGALFKRSWFARAKAVPAGAKRTRAWDFAATRPALGRSPDWTVGVRVAASAAGFYYVEHVERLQGSSHEVDRALLVTSQADQRAGPTRVRIPQDPGAAGKARAESQMRLLAGFDVRARTVSGAKETRAAPAAAQAEAGNIFILETGDADLDAWIEPFLAELIAFPGGRHDDQVDAFADAFNDLAVPVLPGQGLLDLLTRQSTSS